MQGDMLTLPGGINFGNFQVLDSKTNQPTVQEQMLAIAYPSLSIDLAHKNLVISKDKPLAITMQSSGALALQVYGQVNDLSAKREMKDLTVAMSYDLGKLWPMIQPLPGRTAAGRTASRARPVLDGMVLSGKADNQTIVVNDNLPANEKFNKAITGLEAHNGLAVASCVYDGLNIQNLTLPFHLSKESSRSTIRRRQHATAAPSISPARRSISPAIIHSSIFRQAGEYILQGIALNPVLASKLAYDRRPVAG